MRLAMAPARSEVKTAPSADDARTQVIAESEAW